MEIIFNTNKANIKILNAQGFKHVAVCAIEGNFDDAQNGVKKIFSDAEINKKLNDGGYILTSANSINWGRLAPQIVYYISAYADLVAEGDIKAGENVIKYGMPIGHATEEIPAEEAPSDEAPAADNGKGSSMRHSLDAIRRRREMKK